MKFFSISVLIELKLIIIWRINEVSHLSSTYSELYGAIARLGLDDAWSVKLQPLQMYNHVTGNYILFRGCNDLRAIERLKSITVPEGKLCWIWIEEATEITADDFEILDDRLRGTLTSDFFYYQITLTFNPVTALHWIKKRLWDYEDRNTFKHRSTYLDNRYIDPGYVERMERRKELDPEGYKVYALGQWGELGGTIFTRIEIADLSSRVFELHSMGVDFGFNHASVCLLVAHHDGDIYILKEIYTKWKTNREFIDLINESRMPKNIAMYCDSAEPDRIKELCQAGYRARAVKKETNSVKRQIDWLKQRKIYIDETCTNTIREIQAYRYKTDLKTGENIDEPLEYDDDCMAALRYGIEAQRKGPSVRAVCKSLLEL